MSKSKKIVKDDDGTPMEVEGDGPEEVIYPHKAKVVVWTKKAEDEAVFSEHGTHRAGDEVSTEYADLFVERGHAKLKGAE